MKKFSCALLMILCMTALFSGCTQSAEKDKIWILSDFTESPSFAGGDYANVETSQLLHSIENALRIDGEKLEIEFLPENEAEREIRISNLRTQIMSGGGPDLFLLSGNIPGWEHIPGWTSYRFNHKNSVSVNYGNQLRLFPDVQSAMEQGYFLPLDEYLNNSEWVNFSLIQPALREAGRTGEGQMLIPITCTFSFAVYTVENPDLPENFPTSWDKALDWIDPKVRYAYGVTARRQFPHLFAKLADYKEENLLVSEEELQKSVRQALSLQDENVLEIVDIGGIFPVERYGGLLSLCVLDYPDLNLWSPNFTNYAGARSEKDLENLAFEPVRNTKGGVTANITSYLCINRNTKHPDEAFRILDFLESTPIQNGMGMDVGSGVFCQSTIFSACYGVPARNDLLQSHELSFVQNFTSQENIWNGYAAAHEQITSARVFGPLDMEIQKMLEACLEAESDEEIEKIVSKAYDTMLMILAES